jgi:hypothetical protein
MRTYVTPYVFCNINISDIELLNSLTFKYLFHAIPRYKIIILVSYEKKLHCEYFDSRATKMRSEKVSREIA